MGTPTAAFAPESRSKTEWGSPAVDVCWLCVRWLFSAEEAVGLRIRSASFGRLSNPNAKVAPPAASIVMTAVGPPVAIITSQNRRFAKSR